MSISAVGSGGGFPPPIESQPPAAQSTLAMAKDPDHDGDHDTPGRLDVKA